jgi:hypothetical protein
MFLLAMHFIFSKNLTVQYLGKSLKTFTTILASDLKSLSSSGDTFTQPLVG